MRQSSYGDGDEHEKDEPETPNMGTLYKKQLFVPDEAAEGKIRLAEIHNGSKNFPWGKTPGPKVT